MKLPVVPSKAVIGLKRIIVVLLAVVLLAALTGCEKEGDNTDKQMILAEDWLLQQESMDADLQEVMEFADNVYSLYIGNKMSAQDFLAQLQIGQEQLFIVQHKYEERKEQYVFDTQSDETAMHAVEALESFFVDANKMFVASFTESGEAFLPIEVAYIYMNYKNKLEDEYLDYAATVIVLKQHQNTETSSGSDHQDESEVNTGTSSLS